jgi:hypothetical protein
MVRVVALAVPLAQLEGLQYWAVPVVVGVRVPPALTMLKLLLGLLGVVVHSQRVVLAARSTPRVLREVNPPRWLILARALAVVGAGVQAQTSSANR